jgi:hypothetical protein
MPEDTTADQNSSRQRRNVINSGASNLINTLRRIGLWFGSLLLSVALFSLFFALLNSGPGFFRAESVFFTFRVTMIFALPAWFLYLPFVIALRDAEERRSLTILASGTVVGPASLVLWGLLLQLGGADPQTIWQGDPLAFGFLESMIFALIVGFLTTSFYVVALKVLHRWPATKNRFTWT